MDIDPTISVVIPTYMSTAWIERCVAAVRGAAVRYPLDIIVVDNDSTDDTADKAERLPGVRVLRNECNLGFAAAVNRGITHSEGNIIAVLNPDVMLGPAALDLAADYILGHRDVGIVGGKVLDEQNRPVPYHRLYPGFWTTVLQHSAIHYRSTPGSPTSVDARMPQDDAGATPMPMVGGCFMVTTRSVVQAVGMLDERFPLFYEDHDWCARVARAGLKQVYVPCIAVHHAGGHSASQESLRTTLLRHRSLYLYLRKHRGAVCVACCWLTVVTGVAVRLLWRGIRCLAAGRPADHQATVAHLWLVLKWHVGAPSARALGQLRSRTPTSGGNAST